MFLVYWCGAHLGCSLPLYGSPWLPCQSAYLVHGSWYVIYCPEPEPHVLDTLCAEGMGGLSKRPYYQTYSVLDRRCHGYALFLQLKSVVSGGRWKLTAGIVLNWLSVESHWNLLHNCSRVSRVNRRYVSNVNFCSTLLSCYSGCGNWCQCNMFTLWYYRLTDITDTTGNELSTNISQMTSRTHPHHLNQVRLTVKVRTSMRNQKNHHLPDQFFCFTVLHIVSTFSDISQLSHLEQAVWHSSTWGSPSNLSPVAARFTQSLLRAGPVMPALGV